jgi:hypothetical protein
MQDDLDRMQRGAPAKRPRPAGQALAVTARSAIRRAVGLVPRVTASLRRRSQDNLR